MSRQTIASILLFGLAIALTQVMGALLEASRTTHPTNADAAKASGTDFSKIKKAQGGKTIAEIYAGKAKLNGQQTSVRGKVVKYNEMIMGKNWVHIQDGTGAVGSNDLLVTTATQVKVGDTVLVTGKVATDKDFGSNYKYAIMIEDAKIVIE